MITGESRPVKKGEGDKVIAGTINGEGSLRVEVTGTGEETTLSGIMRLVSDAQQSKSRAQHLADRAAQLLTGVAITAGVLTLIGWQLVGAPIDFSDRARRHGARHRVSARPRPRRAARRVHLDDHGRASRAARARPSRPRGSTQPGCRRLRQDRHAHAR
jgi:hypothetical protein